MENNSGQQMAGKKESSGAKNDVELPTETSPYVQYKDLEDYKRQGYGTEGHVDPTPGRGAGATDAPTPSGGGAPASKTGGGGGGGGSATDVINRQGVP